MLFLHEVHQVRGGREDEFDAAFRDSWMPTLATGTDARLLWFLRQAHGSGDAYKVVTVTAVRDGAAWEDLASRVLRGDLELWATEVDTLRHGSSAKILVPTPWSELQTVDLDSVPTSGEQHELSLYMEDTAWPYAGGLAAYLKKAGSLYAPLLAESRKSGRGLLEMQAAFQPAFGTHGVNEVVLWQKIVNHRALLGLFQTETPEAMKGPGTWMHDALEVRDRWRSRLLRTASWSPLY